MMRPRRAVSEDIPHFSVRNYATPNIIEVFVGAASTCNEDFHAEEVTRVQGIPVHLDELVPGSLLLPFWCWIEAGLG